MEKEIKEKQPLNQNRFFAVFQLLRPHQWLKNLFIFLPIFFGRGLFNWSAMWPTVIAFFVFSFTASAVYCFNDIKDVEADRIHPRKCNRPVASGRISVSAAYIIAGILVLLSVAISVVAFSGEKLWKVSGLMLAYFLMNIAYCMKLKQIAILDVFIIALGFVFRVLVGGCASGIWVSQWIILMTFLLTLFLAFAKRRDDVLLFENTGVIMRKNIIRYNLPFLNQVLSIIASVTLVSYIMYTVSDEVIERMQTSYLYITSMWVLAGILRYLQLAIVDSKTGSPTGIFMKDSFIQFCVVAWLLTFVVIIYV